MTNSSRGEKDWYVVGPGFGLIHVRAKNYLSVYDIAASVWPDETFAIYPAADITRHTVVREGERYEGD